MELANMIHTNVLKLHIQIQTRTHPQRVSAIYSCAHDMLLLWAMLSRTDCR